MATRDDPAGGFLAAGGEMGRRVATYDWASTPLGPLEDWPGSLRTAAGICLASRHPMVIWWGPELVLVYNDAWIPILGPSKHPALGKPGATVWPEMWHIIGAQMGQVMAEGQATWSDDQLLPADRYGYLEEAYFTYSYSPIRDESGGVGGVFTAVTETTARVLGDRRLRTLRTLGDIAAVTSPTPADAVRAGLAVLEQNTADVPSAVVVLFGEAGAGPEFVAGYGADVTAAVEVAGAQTPAGFEARYAGTELPHLLQGVGQRFPGLFGRAGAPVGQAPVVDVLVLPLAGAGTARMAGLLLAGVNPYRSLDDDYRGFFELVAGQLSRAVADADAYAAERRRAQALAELDRAKTVFFSNMSHELRTPLTLILGPVEDALAKARPEGEHPEARPGVEVLEMVRHNALRLQRLVEGMLDFSRLEAGRMPADRQPTDLAEFTADLVAQFRSAVERAGLTLTVDCPPLASAVRVDRDMWEKIVLNLLSNALKFTFEGGITVTQRLEGGEAVLSVADTGVGIAAEHLPRLFERFHRVQGTRSRTHEGTGIGLALVNELIRVHDGEVTVESSVGRGATFTVRIPAAEVLPLPAERVTSRRAVGFVEEALRWLPGAGGSAGDAAPVPGQEPAGSGEERVVVIDDNADLREYLCRILGAAWTVETYSDGAVALEAILADPPALVISDVMMPGLDGFGVLKALRSDPATRRLPFILLSARAGEEAAVEGLAEGADDYLVKPFSSRELVARVRANLDLARLREEAAAAAEAQARRLRLLAATATEIGRCPTVDGCLELVAAAARSIIGSARASAVLHEAGRDAEEPTERRGGFAVPMLAGDHRPIGVLVVGEKPGGGFDASDEDIAIQLAQLAAGRIDALQALGREHRVAVTLQESLLPRRLAVRSGLQLAAHYRPGSSEAAVGGDWYDTVALADGSLAVVVGDVVGRGVQAAATMGQLRNAIRAFLLQGHGPGAALELLNQLVASLGQTHFSTALVAQLSPDDGSLRLASAGHPPPLIVPAGGSPRWLEGARSVPLGAVANAHYPEEVVGFDPADTLLAYTDGLVEGNRMPLDPGLGLLFDLTSRYSGDAELLADAVLAGMTGGGDALDDIVVLALTRLPTAPHEPLMLSFPPGVAAVRRARSRLQGWLESLEMSEEEGYDIVLAAAECVANAVEHPVHPLLPVVTMSASIDGESVMVTVSDRGQWRQTEPRPERGRGLRIIEGFTDEHHIMRSAAGTTVTLRKRFGRSALEPEGGTAA